MKPIYVDIDGTLTVETEGYGEVAYRNRTPRKDIIAAVNALYDAGKFIVLWTSRYEEDRTTTIRWMKENGVKYHKLIMDKPQYGMFIDDRVMTPEVFKQVMEVIKRYELISG